MQGFRQQGNALIWQRNHETLQIEPWGRNSLRVRATVGPDISGRSSAGAARHSFERGGYRDSGRSAPQSDTVPSLRRSALIETSGSCPNLYSAGRIRFLNTETGAELLEEKKPGFRAPPARHFKLSLERPLPPRDVVLRVRWRADLRLGQQQHGLLDQKGCVIDLIQRNTEVTIPFLLSSRGYGFLWNNPAVGRVELGADAYALGGRGDPAVGLLDHGRRHAGRYPGRTTRTPPVMRRVSRVGRGILAEQAALSHAGRAAQRRA